MPITSARFSFIANRGFTLVEIAIVILIVTLLLTGLIPTISSQIEQRQTNETRKQLDEIRDSLLGFAVTQGRLPCPASDTSNGKESFCTNALGACGAEIFFPAALPIHGRCAKPYDGLVPAVTIGITQTDDEGYMLDGWSNRIHYAVTIANNNAFTKANGMKALGMVALAPDLFVCASATGLPAFPSADCGAATILTSNGVTVIYSVGMKPVAGGIDEAANLNDDQVFVNHVPSPATAPNGEFDDIVTWISPNILFNRMVMAGQLP
ncbi:MAG: prepilin-type N-terminal cleavage/methylation domain-containing protein [Nitrosomonadales bacterium]|nr:prepilin-type N-terminal cleavage/methylation domain-containing protein [Nitrosomonadales bacterium]